MPLPATRVKATTHRRDSPEVAKLWLRLVFMQLTRDLFAIDKFLYNAPDIRFSPAQPRFYRLL